MFRVGFTASTLLAGNRQVEALKGNCSCNILRDSLLSNLAHLQQLQKRMAVKEN